MKLINVDTWEIITPKQDNGLWGMPLQCVKFDGFVMLNEENDVKRSAILIAIAERFTGETFEVFWSDEDGFFVTLSRSGIRSIKYREYKVEDNNLIYLK